MLVANVTRRDTVVFSSVRCFQSFTHLLERDRIDLTCGITNLATDDLQIPAVTLTDAPLSCIGRKVRKRYQAFLLVCGASCEVRNIYEI